MKNIGKDQADMNLGGAKAVNRSSGKKEQQTEEENQSQKLQHYVFDTMGKENITYHSSGGRAKHLFQRDDNQNNTSFRSNNRCLKTMKQSLPRSTGKLFELKILF